MTKDNRPYVRLEDEIDDCDGCAFDADETCPGGCGDSIWVARKPSMLEVLLPMIYLFLGVIVGLVAGIAIATRGGM